MDTGIGCWISGLGYGQISTPLNGFGFEYDRKISVSFSSLIISNLSETAFKQHRGRSHSRRAYELGLYTIHLATLAIYF